MAVCTQFPFVMHIPTSLAVRVLAFLHEITAGPQHDGPQPFFIRREDATIHGRAAVSPMTVLPSSMWTVTSVGRRVIRRPEHLAHTETLGITASSTSPTSSTSSAYVPILSSHISSSFLFTSSSHSLSSTSLTSRPSADHSPATTTAKPPSSSVDFVNPTPISSATPKASSANSASQVPCITSTASQRQVLSTGSCAVSITSVADPPETASSTTPTFTTSPAPSPGSKTPISPDPVPESTKSSKFFPIATGQTSQLPPLQTTAQNSGSVPEPTTQLISQSRADTTAPGNGSTRKPSQPPAQGPTATTSQSTLSHTEPTSITSTPSPPYLQSSGTILPTQPQMAAAQTPNVLQATQPPLQPTKPTDVYSTTQALQMELVSTSHRGQAPNASSTTLAQPPRVSQSQATETATNKSSPPVPFGPQSPKSKFSNSFVGSKTISLGSVSSWQNISTRVSGAVIVNSTNLNTISKPTPEPVVVIIDSSTITANAASGFVIGSQTLFPGSAITNGREVITLPFPAEAQTPHPITTASLVPQQLITSLIIAGQTLTTGGHITVGDNILSLEPSGMGVVVVGTITVGGVGSAATATTKKKNAGDKMRAGVFIIGLQFSLSILVFCLR